MIIISQNNKHLRRRDTTRQLNPPIVGRQRRLSQHELLVNTDWLGGRAAGATQTCVRTHAKNACVDSGADDGLMG